MLPFLAFPRHFTQTPIAKEGLRFLCQVMPERTRWWRLAEILLIAVCLVISVVPIFIPIFTVRRMFAVYVPTVLLSWLIITRTMLCGAMLGSREQAFGVWDDLILTSMDAQQIILGKWWATVRYCWRSHALMIVLRLITAYHIASFFMFAPAAGRIGVTLGNICPPGMNAFCYGLMGFMPYPFNFAYSQPLFMFGLLGIAVLFVSGLLELGLAAIIGVCTAIVSSFSNKSLLARISRALLVAAAVAVLVLGNRYYDFILSDSRNGYGDAWYGIIYNQRIDLLETLQTAVSPLVDQGILLTANFLRPYGYANSVFYQVRQGLSVLLSWLIYAAIYLIVMWAALETAIQQRALPDAIGADS